jgi:hypothetical protein
MPTLTRVWRMLRFVRSEGARRWGVSITSAVSGAAGRGQVMVALSQLRVPTASQMPSHYCAGVSG